MTNKAIKQKMNEYYRYLNERDDDSYNELYNALHTLRNAGLISIDQWLAIVEHDHKLFTEWTNELFK